MAKGKLNCKEYKKQKISKKWLRLEKNSGLCARQWQRSGSWSCAQTYHGSKERPMYYKHACPMATI